MLPSVLLVALLQAGAAPVTHVGPASLYPDQTLTPGKAATVSFVDLTKQYPCPRAIKKKNCTYSQAHRSVNARAHRQVYDEYKVPSGKRNFKAGEVDHFDPLCNGGSNDIQNLWFQPIHAIWQGRDYGYKTKDRLEAFVCIEVKAKRLDPAVAYRKLTTDWVQFFLDTEARLPKTGAGVQ